MLSDELTSSKHYREVFFYKNYFLDFFNELEPNIRSKVEWVLNLIQVHDRIPSKFLKHIEGTNGLYEIRIEFESNHIRVFAFFVDANLLILLNGFFKKSRRTSLKEIRKAVRIRKDYYEEKI